MILILASGLTSRLQYTVETIFGNFLQVDYQLTDDKEYFLSHSGEKINYTKEYLTGIPWIEPQGLLSSTSISNINPDISLFQGIPLLFSSRNEKNLLPFDVFAAVFFMLSRYEEYLPYNKDHHGRFPATESIAYKNHFLDLPVVDHWIDLLHPFFSNRRFRYISSLDIDVAYAYKHKGWARNTGGFLTSLFRADFGSLSERFNTLARLQPDPYDTYRYIQHFHASNSLSPLFFVLFSGYGKYDKNLSRNNSSFHRLIKELDQAGEVGIHPSYSSSLQPVFIEQETNALAQVLGRPVTKSRHHYLRISLPETYRILISCGIEEDFSMGYADIPGFRAGTCTPYTFYDLKEEKKTSLKVYPFAVMEGTLRDYLQLDPEDALQVFNNYISRVKEVNGTYLSLWHNESLNNLKRWKGWRDIFEKTTYHANSQARE